MSTLKEQRLCAAHRLGMRDYQNGNDLRIPVYLHDQEERDAYRAGYFGAQRRANGSKY